MTQFSSNTLVDNSENLTMRDLLNNFLSNHIYNEFCIATGYWDLPGLLEVQEELETFLKNGGRLKMIIGKEPVVRSYQLKNADD